MKVGEKLGLGTAQFGMRYGISNSFGQTSPAEVTRILNIASTSGITLLDTASAYGCAEEVLGNNELGGFQVVSKFLGAIDSTLLRSQLRKTLSSLKITTLYGYLAHRPLQIITNPWQWEELGWFKERGFISKRGFSLNEPSELQALLDKGFIPDIIQVPYNYLDRRFEPLMLTLRTAGSEVHCRSAFLQGLFFKDADALPDFFSEVRPLLIKLQSQGTRLPGALLKFVLEKPFVDKVIMGVENERQLMENLREIEIAPALPLISENIPEDILMPSNWPTCE